LIKPFGFAQGETKKIKAANKKAENLILILKSRNSPPVVQRFRAYARLKQPCLLDAVRQA